jgi:hypothetical protein
VHRCLNKECWLSKGDIQPVWGEEVALLSGRMIDFPGGRLVKRVPY